MLQLIYLSQINLLVIFSIYRIVLSLKRLQVKNIF